jgi:hypothetical protein
MKRAPAAWALILGGAGYVLGDLVQAALSVFAFATGAGFGMAWRELPWGRADTERDDCRGG